MSSILLLIVCLALGVIVARTAKPSPVLAQSLNWWVLNVALSALVLHLIPKLQFEWHLWFLIASMWFVFLGAWALFALLGRALHWTRARIGALTLVCGLGNTSFIGFPLIEALRGQEGLTYALIADQAGCFIALAVGGTIVAALYSGGTVTTTAIARKVLWFPPFISLIAGAIVGAFGGWPDTVDDMLSRIGATLVPLALFSVGLQFRLRFEHGLMRAIGAGLAWKLALAPLLVYVAGAALGVSSGVLTISVLESAMAPMVSATILAEQNDLEPPLANTVLGAGIVLSFATVPLANYLLGV
ncbi:MAG: AEC family transporter [Steroidobacter sp.]